MLKVEIISVSRDWEERYLAVFDYRTLQLIGSLGVWKVLQNYGVASCMKILFMFEGISFYSPLTPLQVGLTGVEKAARTALSQTCAFCRHKGASVSCRYPGCDRSFHFPCAAGAGCLQEVETLELLCPMHLNETHLFGKSCHTMYMIQILSRFSALFFISN